MEADLVLKFASLVTAVSFGAIAALVSMSKLYPAVTNTIALILAVVAFQFLMAALVVTWHLLTSDGFIGIISAISIATTSIFLIFAWLQLGKIVLNYHVLLMVSRNLKKG